MPNYYHNKLIITGDPADLIQFKKFIGENIPKDFSMYTLNPVPSEIENDSEASASWRKQNWGCKGDMRDINVLQNSEEALIISYLTPWLPNNRFVWYLNQKFSSLIFELLYFEGIIECAGILIMYKDEWWNDVPHPFNIIDFVKNNNDQKYTAIHYNREKNIRTDDYDICISLTMIGDRFYEEIEGYNFNEENVSNWHEFLQLIDEIKNEIEYNYSLRISDEVKDSDMNFQKSSSSENITTPPPLPLFDSDQDLPF